jgi:hypothetical protein
MRDMEKTKDTHTTSVCVYLSCYNLQHMEGCKA